jgi:hypothetical protein
VVLLVLLQQPLKAAKWWVEPDQHIRHPGLAPALLAADDLVVAGHRR